MLATINTRPVKLWRGLHDDMERWLSAADWQVDAPSTWVPSVDVVEQADHYVFYADLPGVELNQIDVLFDEGQLTIKGERSVKQASEDEQDDEQNGFRRIERSHGTFQRKFRLPDAIDADNITAKSNHGVLEVRVPKQAKTQRKIDIQS